MKLKPYTVEFVVTVGPTDAGDAVLAEHTADSLHRAISRHLGLPTENKLVTVEVKRA